MTKASFVHLHVHSHYSLLDGLGKIPDLVSKAAELGMSALAITDHGVMHGAIEFYLECQKQGIKPIIGQEAYVTRRKIGDKTAGEDVKPYHLLLLAKNFQGYQNLIKLTSIAHLQGYYYKPRLDRDLLSRYSEGLIATTACLASETSRAIISNDLAQAETTINEYREIFGPDNYYLELQHHPSMPEQFVVNQHLKDLAKKTNLPLVATNDVHYISSDDRISHDLLVCIQTGKLVSDTDRMIYAGDFSLKAPSEIAEAFPDVPESLSNTVKIADMVDLTIPLDQSLLPKFQLPSNETEESYLKSWCEKGLRERYSEITIEVRYRLDYELETVLKTGFPGYFLIVADLIKFARSKGIYVGPGRGSAAGSIIAYVIGITNVDPLKYGLLFERFLDLNRISMPDIDMDFEDTRRGEVIEYLKQKYGQDHVAGIITFGTIMARAAIRDVGRVLGVPYTKVDALAKLVPPPVQGHHTPLKQLVIEAPELKAAYDSDPENKQLIDAATRLEGTIRHASQHACAIVISKEPLENYVAVQPSQGGDVHQITQYSMGPIEKIGLLKMDLLGLSNLTTMHRATEIIEAVYGDKIDIENLPLDDQKTFELLGRGECVGVFQLESSGMRRYIKELKPTKFEDITAMVSLYRPGPIQSIQSFINRKNGLEDVKYLHPLAESALRDTYGIPVYQEQVMRMSKDMSGFTGAEADTLRKAIGKKIPKLMKEMKAKFIDGAMKNGVAKEQATEIFRQLEDFAAYAFNKSHATCYAIIAYQTAYLKAHYPDCFMAAVMTSDLGDTDRLAIEIAEVERLGLKVLPPDVNESFSDFAVVKESHSIRFGLAAIKNVGEGVAKLIVTERKKAGIYKDLNDFLLRNAAQLNKKVLENLIKAGALDRFGERATLNAGVELISKFVASLGRTDASQLSIFGDDSKESALPVLDLPVVVVDSAAYLTWEKELLGLYLSDHPLKQFGKLLAEVAVPIAELSISQAGQVVRVGGIIHSIKKITTKNGQTMGFIELEDLTGTLELVVFPTHFQELAHLWQAEMMILIEGKISDKDNAVKVLVDRAWALPGLNPLNLPKINQRSANGRQPYDWVRGQQSANYQKPKADSPSTGFGVKPPTESFIIDLPKSANIETISKLKKILEAHPGTLPVELRMMQGERLKLVPTKITVERSGELSAALEAILGKNS